MVTKETVLYHLQHLRQLVFEVTDLCNLNCKYCGLSQLYEGHGERNGRNLSFKKARLIIDYLLSIRDQSPDVNYPLVFSFYGGEPLLNMKLIKQIINYLDNLYFSKVTFGMTTNAMLLDKHMDFLVEKKFQLVISLDGNEAGQSYRVDHAGKNSFQRVFRNIKSLQEKYPDYFQNFVLFNSVLHNRNNVESTYCFIKGHFDKIPLIASLNAIGVREDKIQEFKRMYQNPHESILQSGNCEALEAEMFVHTPRILNLTHYIFRHSGNTFSDFNDLIFDTSGMSSKQTGTCSPFAKKMFVTVNGKILQCERISHHFALGEILDDRVELNIDNIVSKQNQYLSKCSEQCNRCYLKEECPQCVYNIADISKEQPNCANFCSKDKYERDKEMTTDYLREHPQYYEKILKEVTVKY
jgi:uncharacterized protein